MRYDAFILDGNSLPEVPSALVSIGLYKGPATRCLTQKGALETLLVSAASRGAF